MFPFDFVGIAGIRCLSADKDGLAPIVALLQEQAVRTSRLGSTADSSQWREYLIAVRHRIQELRHIHPPNGTL